MHLPRTVLALAAGVALAAPALPGQAAPPTPAPLLAATGTAVPGSYVVVLHPGREPHGVVRGLQVKASHVYEAALEGFAAELTPAQLERVRQDPAVAWVEPDQVVRADAREATRLYGLDRSDQRSLPLSGSYTYRTGAATVKAYVIDTGIDAAHPDFGGRARSVFDATGGSGRDCHGHGTHVAGTIGGRTHGIAKAVQLRGVRVLDCSGSGSTRQVIAGLDWVRTHARGPAVANLSLSGPASAAENRAVAALSASGVLVVVAAGNEGGDACGSSPASAPAAVTVAATDRRDTRPSYSNAGSCVDVYAPGDGVTSTWPGGTTRTLNGTSMASPHVAGVAALYKGTHGQKSSAAVTDWLLRTATTGKVRNNVRGTPNRLLFTGGL